MTPDDFDNGRPICLIGVAAVKPAAFVVFRISQKDQKDMFHRLGAEAGQ
jgi:phage tail sheath protein FI